MLPLRQAVSRQAFTRAILKQPSTRTHFACRRASRSIMSRGQLQCQALFKFGKSDTAEKKYASSMSREEYTTMDVEDYFNYMGMLAAEGNYDRMERMLETGVAPADLLLLMAASENDAPKVAELLRAGADISAQDMNGKKAEELTEDPDVLELLSDRQKAFSF